MHVHVGTDVQSIDEVRDSLEVFAERYARKVFTNHEIDCCGGCIPAAAPGLTARFAAKEAVIKLLSPVDELMTWRSIELRRQVGGSCSVELSGDAARLATDKGLGEISISMSHGAGVATATAVALSAS